MRVYTLRTCLEDLTGELSGLFLGETSIEFFGYYGFASKWFDEDLSTYLTIESRAAIMFLNYLNLLIFGKWFSYFTF